MVRAVVKNQINFLREFVCTKKSTLVINNINEAIDFFYIGVIKFFAKENKLRIIINDNSINTLDINDLFENNNLTIYFNTNSKKISELIAKEEKKVIFTDYRNYKKINSLVDSLNSYQHDKDITSFIKDILKIENDDLVFYCKTNPAFIFSEISKYLINKNYYLRDRQLEEEINHIAEIRKSIFDLKKNNIDMKKLYFQIKSEAKYKKFSFLTY